MLLFTHAKAFCPHYLKISLRVECKIFGNHLDTTLLKCCCLDGFRKKNERIFYFIVITERTAPPLCDSDLLYCIEENDKRSLRRTLDTGGINRQCKLCHLDTI